MWSRADAVQSMQAGQLIARLSAGYFMARCVLYSVCSSASNKSSHAGQCASPLAGSGRNDPVISLTTDVNGLEHAFLIAFCWLTASACDISQFVIAEESRSQLQPSATSPCFSHSRPRQSLLIA